MEFERLANAIAEVLDIDASKITPDSKFVEDLGEIGRASCRERV